MDICYIPPDLSKKGVQLCQKPPFLTGICCCGRGINGMCASDVCLLYVEGIV